MRLINAVTLELESFEENAIPPYAILSHTWGADEVSFQDFQQLDSAARKQGFAKIKFTCVEALERGLDYTWVDTCCIDKTSSAELSEAINSMFNWYTLARECYAYLSDVPHGDNMGSPDSAFQRSRWFTRGWTLQELLAPKELYFFSGDFRFIGCGANLAMELSAASGIGEDYLTGASSVFSASVSRRMSWASTRVTSRREDLAYCLMGIFNINMPLLYGEGEKAFLRLQEEIIKTSDDQTIFAWADPSGPETEYILDGPQCIFARRPSYFLNSGYLIPDELSRSVDHYFMTNKGLKITLPVMQSHDGHGTIAILACRHEHSLFKVVAIPILRGSTSCVRNSSRIVEIDRRDRSQDWSINCIESLMLLHSLNPITHNAELSQRYPFLVRTLPSGLKIENVRNSGGWDTQHDIIQRPTGDMAPITLVLCGSMIPSRCMAVVQIHHHASNTFQHLLSVVKYPHAFLKVYDIRTGELGPYAKDDVMAIRATFSKHPTRLAWGLDVVVLDVEYVEQTKLAMGERRFLFTHDKRVTTRDANEFDLTKRSSGMYQYPDFSECRTLYSQSRDLGLINTFEFKSVGYGHCFQSPG